MVTGRATRRESLNVLSAGLFVNNTLCLVAGKTLLQEINVGAAPALVNLIDHHSLHVKQEVQSIAFLLEAITCDHDVEVAGVAGTFDPVRH